MDLAGIIMAGAEGGFGGCVGRRGILLGGCYRRPKGPQKRIPPREKSIEFSIGRKLKAMANSYS